MPRITNKVCPYEYTKGKKKGTTCNVGCEGDFCSQHTPKRRLSKAKFHEEKRNQKF